MRSSAGRRNGAAASTAEPAAIRDPFGQEDAEAMSEGAAGGFAA